MDLELADPLMMLKKSIQQRGEIDQKSSHPIN
jgi:hypothetical protein